MKIKSRQEHIFQNNRFFKRVFRNFALLLFVCLASFSARANPFEWAANYVYNRVTDALEVVRFGVAVGPGVGAEVAISDKLQIGAYVGCQAGVSFPHFFPPLWPITHADGGEVLAVHQGTYATFVFGDYRVQNTLRRQVRFPRSPTEVRVQVAVVAVQAYVSVDYYQLADFVVGFFGFDPMQDDK